MCPCDFFLAGKRSLGGMAQTFGRQCLLLTFAFIDGDLRALIFILIPIRSMHILNLPKREVYIECDIWSRKQLIADNLYVQCVIPNTHGG